MSKPLVVSIPHELGRAEARRRIDSGLSQLTAQIGAVGKLEQAWDGDVLRFAVHAVGQTIRGSVNVLEHEARLEVILPAVLGLLAGKLKGRIQNEGQVLLGGPKKT